MTLWHEEEDEPQVTYYTRTASLLDVLFKDTGIVDGETGSHTSKVVLEINRCIFGDIYSSSSSSTYPRKIDLLLKYNCSEKVELSSNEWKKARVTHDAALSTDEELESKLCYNQLWPV